MNHADGAKIIAHRGLWEKAAEKNTAVAFERAFDRGFGVETDLRDAVGEIVISHNMPHGDEIRFEELLQMMQGRNLPLALNIKADGQAVEIKRLLNKYKHDNYFTFDMSIPEMVVQQDAGLRVFTGQSDLIAQPILEEGAAGIWLDSFHSDWFGGDEIAKILSRGKEVCIVSPELHGREHTSVWARYRGIGGIMLCTDYPLEAEVYFNGEN